VEFTLALPLLLFLLFGIIDFGALFASWNELRSASRDGARIAAVDNACFPGSPDYTAVRCTGSSGAQLANLKTDTKARATGLVDVSSLTVTVCYPSTPTVGKDNVSLTLTYPGRSMTGFFGFMLDGITLQSTAVMRLEQVPTYAMDTTCP
jgi:Flp pilus assembly protein TadG